MNGGIRHECTPTSSSARPKIPFVSRFRRPCRISDISHEAVNSVFCMVRPNSVVLRRNVPYTTVFDDIMQNLFDDLKLLLADDERFSD